MKKEGWPDKQAFFRFLRETGALQFGTFILKNGRKSPYFFNSGCFSSAGILQRLGGFYAQLVQRHVPEATVIAGPAYKGIPLCIATAQALEAEQGRKMGYLYNRKESKPHGDGGLFVGYLPGDNDQLVLVDDVISDGATKREAVAQLRKAFKAPIKALIIAFDRMEQSTNGASASTEFKEATDIPVHALFSLVDLETQLEREYAEGAAEAASLLDALRAYRAKYGAPP